MTAPGAKSDLPIPLANSTFYDYNLLDDLAQITDSNGAITMSG
jgi:hypothetical protein